MPHVLIAGRIHPSGVELARAAPGVTVDYVEDGAPDAFAPFLGGADALVIRTQPLTAAMIAAAPRLRIVSRHGVGYDSVDVAALNARGIPLAIVGDVNSRSVAEHAMALMLACAKQVREMDAAVREHAWSRRDGYAGRELGGARLLIVGYGRAGRLLAQMAAGFGMEIDAFDPFLPAGSTPAPVRMVPDLGAALAQADFVSVHAPKGAAPVLGAAEIARLKPGAIVVNTARGGVVDEAALAEALRKGHVAAAGIDVFGDEPPAPGAELTGLPGTVLSPHVAGLSQQSMERMAVVSVRNALDCLAGRLDPALVVNAAALAARG